MSQQPPVVRPPPPTANPYFTPEHMKTVAIVVVTLDLVLLVVWFASSIFLLVTADQVCYAAEFVLHFFIMVHFALGMAISNIVGIIDKEQYEYRERLLASGLSLAVAKTRKLQYLPYVVYSPFSWIFTALIALSGDTILLASAIRLYQLGGDLGDSCQDFRIARIAFDSLATAVSVITIIWFILFAAYCIAPEREAEERQTSTVAPVPMKQRVNRLLSANQNLRQRTIRQASSSSFYTAPQATNTVYR
jgi:hypothetical protein